ncbi:MAG: enoyl-CoA hydratase/isomerase family protein [Dehalococcoidia bacterium]|nr:enoyl-CoA hydratase/isomerase family protein [Dehalococcoidia bacterium]
MVELELEFCTYEKRGPVAYVTIARPEVMNALHAEAHFELASVWDDFLADAGLRVGVLTGEGDRAFCAGRDLKDRARRSGDGPDRPATGGGGLTHRFEREKPIIARVNGFALGGGLEIALACDIIVAADHAEFALPEPRRGLIAGALGVHRLPRHLPLKVAMGYLLSGRHMDARRSFEVGLVNEVVPYSRLDAAVERWVAEILESGRETAGAWELAVR